jgi:16S rRNA (guanine527-N7)-methyltransferase
VDVREIDQAIRALGLSVTRAQLDLLTNYVELLAVWNRRINLTALPLDSDSPVAIARLIIEPLIAAQVLPDEDLQILDLGSGGGSPAIPLKIVRPRCRLTMVEARQKKASFLREVVRHLALENAAVLNARVESLELPEAYRVSVITARALRLDSKMLNHLDRWCDPSTRLLLFGVTEPYDERLTRIRTVELPDGRQPITVWKIKSRT